MSYGFQPGGGPPYQPNAPPYQSGPPPPYQPAAMSYQPGAPPYEAAAPPYQVGAPPYQQGAPPYQPRSAVIRSIASGLCVDGTEYDVKLQTYTGAPTQLWILEPLGGNRFIIVNKANGAALDIEGGPDCGANLITYEKHGGTNQQWFVNPDNTITCVEGNLAVDVCDGNCFPGNILIAYDRHGGQNQQFQVQYQ